MAQKTLLIVTKSGNLDLVDQVERTQKYIRSSKAKNTREAYRRAFADFKIWCGHHQLDYLPAEPGTVAMYLSDLAVGGLKVSTIKQRLYGIRFVHVSKGYESPTDHEGIKATFEGIARTHGSAPQQKAAAMIEIIRKMVDVQSDSLIGNRNRALILNGFAGCFRRSELVAQDVEDLEFVKEGLIITLRRSKTDQKGQGTKKPIPYGSNPKTCPVRAMQDWLAASGIASGALWRRITKGDHLQPTRLTVWGVLKIIKNTALKAELRPEDFSPHSLRSGLATEASKGGAPLPQIMAQGGWKSASGVMPYIRRGKLFEDNAASKTGL